MSEVIKNEATAQSRRAFVKTAAKVAVTAPAAAMLLNASVKPAKALEPYAGDTGRPSDDFQFIAIDDGGFDDFIISNGDFVP